MKLAQLPLVQLMAFLSFFFFFFLFWSSTLSRLRTFCMRELKPKHLKLLPDCQLFGIRCHLFACKIRSAEILTTCRHIFLILLLHGWADAELFLSAGHGSFQQVYPKGKMVTGEIPYVWHTLPTWLWVSKLFFLTHDYSGSSLIWAWIFFFFPSLDVGLL